MDIAHPKRILLLAPSGVSPSPVLSVLTETAGPRDPRASTQTATSESTQLQSQPIHLISNSYYRAAVPVWADEIQSMDAWAAQWKAEDGAIEVIRAVGAWIVCFHKPATDEAKHAISTLLTTVSSVLSHHESSSTSYSAFDSGSILIALAVPNLLVSSSEPRPIDSRSPSELDLELDDLCRAAGNWEYIDGTIPCRTASPSDQPLNEHGETEGTDRLLEALQGGEWDAADDEVDGGLDGFDDLDVDDEGEQFMGDIVTGFEELLAAGAASRRGLLDAGGRDELDRRAAYDLDQPLARELNDNDDGDETWTVRGLNRTPMQPALEAGHGNGNHDGAIGITSFERLGDNRKGFGSGVEGESDDDVQALQKMMARLQAARDLGADLPAAERRKLAKEAVRGVMRAM